MEGIPAKGVPFPSKMGYKRVKGLTSGRSLPAQKFVECPPRGGGVGTSNSRCIGLFNSGQLMGFRVWTGECSKRNDSAESS